MYGPCTSTKKPLKKNETEKSKLTGGSLHLQPGVAWFSHRLAELSGLVGGSSKGGITGWLWCRCGREMRRDDDNFCLKVLKNLKGSDEVEKNFVVRVGISFNVIIMSLILFSWYQIRVYFPLCLRCRLSIKSYLHHELQDFDGTHFEAEKKDGFCPLERMGLSAYRILPQLVLPLSYYIIVILFVYTYNHLYIVCIWPIILYSRLLSIVAAVISRHLSHLPTFFMPAKQVGMLISI